MCVAVTPLPHVATMGCDRSTPAAWNSGVRGTERGGGGGGKEGGRGKERGSGASKHQMTVYFM